MRCGVCLCLLRGLGVLDLGLWGLRGLIGVSGLKLASVTRGLGVSDFWLSILCLGAWG